MNDDESIFSATIYHDSATSKWIAYLYAEDCSELTHKNYPSLIEAYWGIRAQGYRGVIEIEN